MDGVAYPEEGNAVCFAVEDSSWWFQHRNRVIVEALRRFPPPGAFFDIGGGNGCVARAIQDAGYDVVLVEPGMIGVQNALGRGIHNVIRATLEDLDLRPETISAAGLFDVLEHIQDDRSFVERIHRMLTPGGCLYLTVPAYNLLWSHEDIVAGHFRRHTLGRLQRLLKEAGYAIEFASYFFSFLPVPIFLGRVLPYRFGFGSPTVSQDSVRSSHTLRSGLTSRTIDRLCRAELSRLENLRPLHYGASCLVVARKSIAGPSYRGPLESQCLG